MATLHHLLSPWSTRRRRATVVVGLIAGTLLVTPSALAAPAGGAQADSIKAEIDRLGAQVAAADEALQRTQVEAEAAGEATRAAEAALADARAQSAATAAELQKVRAAVAPMQRDVATLGREAYMGEGRFGSAATLLDSAGPGELLQRAATMELLTADRTEQLRQLRDAEAREARADQAARDAVGRRDQAAHAASEAQAAAETHLAEARARYEDVSAQKQQLDAQLRTAQLELLSQQGAANPQAALAQKQAAPASAPAVGGAGLTAGQVTSCYGPRWGTMHYGIDFAAPIGTPIHVPEAGTVVKAGESTGFGLAVAVQHADGLITLYGHVNQFFVAEGEQVSAGQQIAEVGNRGQSTGPHLHFEVHTGGLFATRIDPGPWLREHGIAIGGC